MADKKFCKVTFYADLTGSDRQFLLNDFAQTMTEAAQIDSVCGVTVTDPNEDRTEELLNNLIEYVSVGRSINETIGILMDYGFTAKELAAYGYSQADIINAEGGDGEDC